MFNFKKKIGMVLSTACLLSLTATSAFAYQGVTVADSDDFTIVGAAFDEEVVGAQLLDDSWQKVDITDASKVTWTSSDDATVKVWDPDANGGRGGWAASVSGITETKLRFENSSQHLDAVVTIDYDNETYTCPINIAKELSSPETSRTGIDVTIDGVNVTDFTTTGITVNNTDLNDIFGVGLDDDDVLKNQPTAMHALLKALQDEFGTSNWDWVSSNVTVGTEGSYVEEIGSDENDWTNGWQFKVKDGANWVDPGKAASIYRLANDEEIKWEFTGWTW